MTDSIYWGTAGDRGRLAVRFAVVVFSLCLLSILGLRAAVADSTGFRNPSAQTAATGGDGNGYETNPTQAFTDANGETEDRDSGTNGNLSCTDAGKDRHLFYNYGFTVPAGATINGIEVLVDARLDSATGFICVQLSWDAGATWTTAKQTTNLTSSFANYTVGGTADTWGRTWSSSDLSNANFRLRVINVANNTSARFRLDWIPAQVHYTPAAPPDTIGPTTSNVAASPNPTAGAASVTLTANISDVGQGGSSIAAAEYFLNSAGAPGTGASMSAADGAFNLPTEAVTVLLSTAGLAAGDHQVFIRGRDGAGNWGSASSTEQTIGGGANLSLSAQPVSFGSVNINGSDQLLMVASPPWRASDGRASGDGWHVTVQSTDVIAALGTIPAGNLKVQVKQSGITTISGNAPPVSLATSYQPLSSSPLKLIAAAPGTGMGTYDFAMEFELMLPASAYAGEYTASLTTSINSGP
ncbi:MAG: hypothetical protein HY873_14385 [Chloroflexi bacterium]|nr:hypothetical protein [Chloroflexota bacterium]